MVPITIAIVFNPACPIILDDDSIIEFHTPRPETLLLLQSHQQVECDTKAIANTWVDWQETPLSHIF
jgi:hypothetical protein